MLAAAGYETAPAAAPGVCSVWSAIICTAAASVSATPASWPAGPGRADPYARGGDDEKAGWCVRTDSETEKACCTPSASETSAGSGDAPPTSRLLVGDVGSSVCATKSSSERAAASSSRSARGEPHVSCGGVLHTLARARLKSRESIS